MLSHVMNLANSIIGVSVLAMPFCFKQCGIILALLILLLSNILSRFACHFLIKSAVISRRKNFEFVAFYAFGPMGKFFVELFIIGFLLGTCIAFFVVVGDLGPQIISSIIDRRPEDIRTSFLITTAVFIILPLGLLRNIDSLTTINTAAIGFYICLVLKVISESTHHIFISDWLEKINFWRPSGILQCLPIFSMALFCQTQLFEIYESVPNSTLEKMNDIVKGALNICTSVYLCVGIFGYIAYYTQPFSGNILLSFEPSFSSEIIKIGFVLSVAFSFPLVIFPCRASLYSLLFKGAYGHEALTNYIPELKFKYLTVTIVSISLMIGISIPNIEFVLGLLGSTIGVMICLIFPMAFFISITTKNTNERVLAQVILVVGILIMVLGTYANLYAMEQSSSHPLSVVSSDKSFREVDSMPRNPISNENLQLSSELKNLNVLERIEEEKIAPPKVPDKLEVVEISRQEPPIPVEKVEPKEEVIDKGKEQINIEEKVKALENEVKEKKVEEEKIIIHDDEIHHEQLKETLEKHRMEQKEMMQEQREILEDIKQQINKLEKLESKKKIDMEESEKVKSKNKIEEVVLEPKLSIEPKLNENVIPDPPRELNKNNVDVDNNKVDTSEIKSKNIEKVKKIEKKLENNEIPNFEPVIKTQEEKVLDKSADLKKNIVENLRTKNESLRSNQKNNFAEPIPIKMNNKSKSILGGNKPQLNESKNDKIVVESVRRELLQDHHIET